MKTDKFGPDGDPFYIVNSGVFPKVKVPSNLLKKQMPLPKIPLENRPIYG
jgi:hypothetical protein